MTAAVMLYAIVVGLLLVPAALLADRTAALRRLPRRWVWVTTLLLTLTIPALAPWRDSSAITPTTDGAGAEPSAATWTVVASGVRGGAATVASAMEAVEPWVATVWIAGSGGVAFVYVAGVMLLLRRRRSWARADVLGTQVLIASDTGPAVVGFRSPLVVIPEWARQLDRESVAIILRHEREHIGARDPWLVHAACVATVLMPWNPAVWWMVARLRLAVEFDCDARVLASGAGSPDEVRRYGELLLTVATRDDAVVPFAAPALLESASSLSRRIAAMCAGPVRFGRTQVAAGAILAAVFVAAACNAPVPTATSEQTAGQAVAPAARESAQGEATSTPGALGPPAEPSRAANPAANDPPPVARANRPAQTPVVVRPGPGVVDPIVVRDVRPAYTADAMRRKVQGQVELEVVVDPEGKVTDVRVVKSLDPDLDLNAMEAARRWAFVPGRREGRPVAVAVNLVMSFTIH